MSRKDPNRLTGRQKAAILMISLGLDVSASVYKHLSEDEIEKLTLEISNVRSVDTAKKDEVIEEFHSIAIAQDYISQGGLMYARQVLEKALGEDKADSILNRLTSSLQVKPFDFARKADPEQILNFIQHEHPQTIALILSYLDPVQAGQILSELGEDVQTEVARRIALMDRTSPEIINEVERILEQKLSSTFTQDYTQTGGVEAVVEVLNGVDRATEKTILDTLEIQDPELADEIKKRMFVFLKILSLLIAEPSSESLEMLKMMTYCSPSKWQAKRSKKLSSATCPSGWSKRSKKKWSFWGLSG